MLLGFASFSDCGTAPKGFYEHLRGIYDPNIRHIQYITVVAEPPGGTPTIKPN
jgi:hypothetical protein